jgi:DNA-binding response OmpR family regulator
MKDIALVVEDDPNLLRVMAAELERMGFEVLTALHYEAAVEHLAARRRPLLACIHLELPTRSGYELCETIRASVHASELLILVTNASALPEDIACAEEAGANAFLAKPFSTREFVGLCRSLLDRARRSVRDPIATEA